MSETITDSRLDAIELRLQYFGNLLEGHVERLEKPEDAALGAFSELIKAHMNSLSDNIAWLAQSIENNVQPEQQDAISQIIDDMIDNVKQGFEELSSRLHEMNETSGCGPLLSNTEKIEQLNRQLDTQTKSLGKLTSEVGIHVKRLRSINLSAGTEVEAQTQLKNGTSISAKKDTNSLAETDTGSLGSSSDLIAANERIADLEARLSTAEEERSQALEERASLSADIESWKSEFEESQRARESIEELLTKQIVAGQERIRALFDQVQDLKGNIRVMCRIRPADPSIPADELADFGPQEPGGRGDLWGKMNLPVEKKSVTGTTVFETKTFDFERIFSTEDTNGDVFAEVKDLVESAMVGRPVCIFTYGQTGSGKTYTLSNRASPGLDSSDNGVIPQTLAMMFEVAAQESDITKFTIEVSVIEIYRDTVYDLLVEPVKGEKVGIRVDQAIFVPLESADAADEILDNATQIRATSATKMNADSSRSHLILTFRIRRETLAGSQMGRVTTGRLNLIDLAGSERTAGQSLQGQQFQEGVSINASLTSLNRAISALGQGTPIAYDTSLLRVLRPALSQGCQTVMFIMVSPLKRDIKISIQTLEKGAEATKARLVSENRRLRSSTTGTTTPTRNSSGLSTPSTTPTPPEQAKLRLRREATRKEKGQSKKKKMESRSSSSGGSYGTEASTKQPVLYAPERYPSLVVCGTNTSVSKHTNHSNSSGGSGNSLTHEDFYPPVRKREVDNMSSTQSEPGT
ncbi:P-loop containing nucleoside triphosphate hydrolase protein [Biscogniauxia marginata]|nr:P-loop containing nucleoside triphosphate hydrolase protein [Biscogniauxia marginata]